MAHQGMTTDTIKIAGHNGDQISAYIAKPLGNGPFPGVVLVHHIPGWDEWYFEATRRFAHHGYTAICPNLFNRAGEGKSDDIAAKVRAEGGIADAQAMGDLNASVKWLRGQSHVNGKVGMFGSCSAGRQTFMYACQYKDIDCAVELWGGRVVMAKEDLNPKMPVAPIDMTAGLSCPLLGLFGNEDKAPTPERATAFSIMTARCIAWIRRWTAGRKCMHSSRSTWRNNRNVIEGKPCVHPSLRSSKPTVWVKAAKDG